MRARILIGYDADVVFAQERTRLSCDIGQQAGPDADLILAPGQVDGDHSHASIASSMRCAVSVCGASSVTT